MYGNVIKSCNNEDGEMESYFTIHCSACNNVVVVADKEFKSPSEHYGSYLFMCAFAYENTLHTTCKSTLFLDERVYNQLIAK